ncbi:uncharacterized protein LOC121836662 [Ixodes scapularis]|uniref:uncharacterized protein LOC121836662 n=1 Tax=Ixodes scapularis TaxID=6945 RepID=UPI001C381649|nr:uncharacterized protein LOC121836662 [Ixodes scapularis]
MAGQVLPPVDICDYIILDIYYDTRDGYKKIDYEFLKGQTGNSKLMFTLPQGSSRSPNVTLYTRRQIVNQQTFKNTARLLYTDMNVRGFGILHFQYGSPTTIRNCAPNLLALYQALDSSLVDAGYQEMTNFFSVYLPYTMTNKQIYTEFLSSLNG